MTTTLSVRIFRGDATDDMVRRKIVVLSRTLRDGAFAERDALDALREMTTTPTDDIEQRAATYLHHALATKLGVQA